MFGPVPDLRTEDEQCHRHAGLGVAPSAGTWTAFVKLRLQRTVGWKQQARQDAQKYMFLRSEPHAACRPDSRVMQNARNDREQIKDQALTSLQQALKN